MRTSSASRDNYINSDVLVSTDTLDNLVLTGGRYGFRWRRTRLTGNNTPMPARPSR